MKTNIKSLKPLFLFLSLVGSFVLLTSAAMADVAPTNTVINTKSSEYPLTICVVSGDKLGQMGQPPALNYEGTEVRFCCKDCIKDFNKDPQKYLKRLNDAKAAPTASQ